MNTETPTIILPASFSESYSHLETYPLNVVQKEWYGVSRLSRIRNRFEERRSSLFVGDLKTNIAIKDVLSDGEVVQRKLHSDLEIRKWLGDGGTSFVGSSETEVLIATKKDPSCRFVVSRLMTYHQVTPNFFEYLDVYGYPLGIDREVRFNGFTTEVYLANPEPGTVLPELGRSGRSYQISYNLKTVALKEHFTKQGKSDSPWQIRQAALHHQFDVGSGVQLWIFGDPRGALRNRMTEHLPEQRSHNETFATVSASFKYSLETQLQLAEWSTDGWRQYILSLEERVEEFTSFLLLSSKDRASRIEPYDLFDVQGCEDDITECVMTLKFNADNMESLSAFYASIVTHDDFPGPERQSCDKHVIRFTSQLSQLIYDAKMQARRAKVLTKIMSDRRTMYVQVHQAQAARQAMQLFTTMWRQAEQTSHEAVAMRIITIITLIYLPPTFVSTLFSTDIVKYQGEDGDVNHDMFSSLALQRFLEFSLPLMLLTFAVAFGWLWYEKIRKRQRLATGFPEVGHGRAEATSHTEGHVVQ